MVYSSIMTQNGHQHKGACATFLTVTLEQVKATICFIINVIIKTIPLNVVIGATVSFNASILIKGMVHKH